MYIYSFFITNAKKKSGTKLGFRGEALVRKNKNSDHKMKNFRMMAIPLFRKMNTDSI